MIVILNSKSVMENQFLCSWLVTKLNLRRKAVRKVDRKIRLWPVDYFTMTCSRLLAQPSPSRNSAITPMYLSIVQSPQICVPIVQSKFYHVLFRLCDFETKSLDCKNGPGLRSSGVNLPLLQYGMAISLVLDLKRSLLR